MERIVNGLLYKTETAVAIAEVYSAGHGGSDFWAWSATLYKTTNGRWFLAGSGGPQTRWAVSAGDMTSGSEGIIPIQPEEARTMLESHGELDALEEHFTIQDA